MTAQRYYVIGGEYADTSFTAPAPGTKLETHGPFSEREAKVFWRGITSKTVDYAMVRYILKPEDQVVGKIYWVVGGEYADSNFTRMAPGKEIEAYGPFEHDEAVGFWRGMTAKTVDDALVRYDIRKDFHREDRIGGSHAMKIGGSREEVRTPLASVVTKGIAIAVSADRLFSYLSDGGNWSQWAIHSVKATRPLAAPGTWEMDTPRGKGLLEIKCDAKSGVLDQVYTADGKVWNCPGRVVPVDGGAVFMFVYSNAQTLTEEGAKLGARVLDEELTTLKKVLEKT